MLHFWMLNPGRKVFDLEEGIRGLAFNILAVTAFPKSEKDDDNMDWKEIESSTERHREILLIVFEHAIILMLIPYRFLTAVLVPARLAKSRSCDLQSYDEAKILSLDGDQRGSNSSHDSRHGILLTALVRPLEPIESCTSNNGVESKESRFSNDEILGNIFIIHFAGHDTVLITLIFALILLDINPGVQEWLREEVIKATQSHPLESWDYNDVFPRLPRCHAVLLVTLHLYAPITGVPKMVPMNADCSSIQATDGYVLVIPHGTKVFLLLLAVQTDPRYWEKPYEWRPSRWVRKKQEMSIVGNGSEDNADEELWTPLRGTFFPWSGGPQVYAGKMFCQVEGVAILACLFHACGLRVEKQVAGSEKQARQRVVDCVNDVNYNLMLRMNHPDKIRLECTTLVSEYIERA